MLPVYAQQGTITMLLWHGKMKKQPGMVCWVRSFVCLFVFVGLKESLFNPSVV